MKKLKKQILFLLMLIIFNGINVYAYSTSNFDDITGSAATFYIMNNFYYDNAFLISTKSVIMTQDDVNYYFNIKAELEMKDSLKNKIAYNQYEARYGKGNSLGMSTTLCEWNMTPIAYSKKDFTNEQINWYYGIDFRGGSEDEDYLNYVYFGTKRVNYFHWAQQYSNHKYTYIYNNDWNEKFFMLYPFLWMNPFSRTNCYNPNTGAHDVNCTGPSVMVRNSEGFSYISNSCSLKEYALDSANKYSKVIYNVESKIGIEKQYINDYKYFAYGGMTFLPYFENHNGFYDYQGIFSTSDTIDLGEYAFCEHIWEYQFEPHSLKHKRKCKNCNWEVEENHNFINEYDGIKNNLCICGYNKKVNLEFEINDDYNTYEKKEVETFGKEEIIEFKNKTGYNFLYYEKTKKEIIGNISTISTIIKTTKKEKVATISDVIENQSIKYKAIFEPLKFTINYITNRGLFDNGEKTIQKNYVYQDNFSFEKMHGMPQDESYFVHWDYNGHPIKKIEDIKNYIKEQNMVINLFAYFERSSIGKSERTKDGKNPRAEGGFDEGTNNDKEDIIKKEENKEIEKVIQIKNKKISKKTKKEKEKEIPVYNMTSTEFNELSKILGIQKASFSEINGKIMHNLLGNNILLNLLLFIIINKWKIALIGIISFLVFLLVKINKKSKSKK